MFGCRCCVDKGGIRRKAQNQIFGFKNFGMFRIKFDRLKSLAFQLSACVKA
jgi:hypothetical protein